MAVAKRMTDYEVMWKRRNMRFLMVFGPVMVLAFTATAIRDQYQVNLKAIQEGHSVGFQFSFLLPIVLGLSGWIVALLCKCQILEDRVAALEQWHRESATTAQR
jgi:hypothetical protein